MDATHVVVYRAPDGYAGWPANYGIWSWGNEIVFGFVAGGFDKAGGFHARRRDLPMTPMQARSLDGGQTWYVAPMPCRTPGGRGLSTDEHILAPEAQIRTAIEQGLENTPQPSPGGIHLTHPDFALMCARTGLHAGTVSWFYTSYDRCRTWDGPYWLPMFDQAGVEARTDYLVSGPAECLLFLTASKPAGREGLGVFTARTIDGGRTFSLASWVTRVTGKGFAIMPASVRLSESHIVSAVRCHGNDKGEPTIDWIDLYASHDNGATWLHVSRPADSIGSNPPALIRLHDGRLCMTYGYRKAPFGIHARLSEDAGQTWGEEIILRNDGGCGDLGYSRTVQRPDGTIVTAYYFAEHRETERYIAATLWRP